jgi:hypothetical protein
MMKTTVSCSPSPVAYPLLSSPLLSSPLLMFDPLSLSKIGERN